ncbi:UDP-N-acetylglucosamine 1-carboxyvinyltransferase [Patescibacteria group bacterium]|nr:UDP-N-acetylglucosamine 1-carboxyvinyltransferase [Patescibacteria group bacterium]
MPEKFIIKGGNSLEGVVEIPGYKNAAGACLAAALLTDEEVIIDNLPLVEDIFKMLKILESMGVEITWLNERKVKIKAGSKTDPEKMTQGPITETRVSVLLIGSLLSRFGKFKISHPGGDRIGVRPITTHLKALKKLGTDIKNEGDFYSFNGKNLESKEIILKEFSVTATENLMMAAARLPEKTIIKGAAAEPQVQDLGEFLRKMGVKIDGLGTHTIFVEGTEKLEGTYHKIIPDLLEAGTFIVAGAVTPGEIEIKNIIPEHLDIFLDKLEEIGVNFERGEDFVRVGDFSQNLKATRVQAFPYPGFQTDLLPIIAPLLTQAKGKSLVHDPLYENRFNFIQELKKMGADIEIVDPHRAFVFGKTSLRGRKIESWDIRAGASLIIAGLIAKGQTTIENIYQIDRGYEKIEQRLQKLGADIKRVKT